MHTFNNLWPSCVATLSLQASLSFKGVFCVLGNVYLGMHVVKLYYSCVMVLLFHWKQAAQTPPSPALRFQRWGEEAASLRGGSDASLVGRFLVVSSDVTIRPVKPRAPLQLPRRTKATRRTHSWTPTVENADRRVKERTGSSWRKEMRGESGTAAAESPADAGASAAQVGRVAAGGLCQVCVYNKRSVVSRYITLKTKQDPSRVL